MAWTLPTTRVTGNLITASIWNTDIVANLILLKTSISNDGLTWSGGLASGTIIAHATAPTLTFSKTNATAQLWDLRYTSGSFQLYDATAALSPIAFQDGGLSVRIGSTATTFDIGLTIRASAVGAGITLRESYAGNSTLFDVVQNNGDGTGVTLALNDGAGNAIFTVTSNPATTKRVEFAGAGTNHHYVQFTNTGGEAFIGQEGSAGGGILTGSSAYALVLRATGTTRSLEFGTNNTVRLAIDSAGVITMPGATSLTIGTTAATYAYAAGVTALAVKGSGSGAGTALGALEMASNAADASGVTTGRITWSMPTNTVSEKRIAEIFGLTTGVTANDRGGQLAFYTKTDGGGLTLRMTMELGLQIGAAPTGGDKGVGTLNAAGDIYKNNSAFTNPSFIFEKMYTGGIIRFQDRAKKIQMQDYSGPMRLEDVEWYVKEHFDLPLMSNLPDAGLFDRGDLLLATVEEAYWYLFRLHERVKHLEARAA